MITTTGSGASQPTVSRSAVCYHPKNKLTPTCDTKIRERKHARQIWPGDFITLQLPWYIGHTDVTYIFGKIFYISPSISLLFLLRDEVQPFIALHCIVLCCLFKPHHEDLHKRLVLPFHLNHYCTSSNGWQSIRMREQEWRMPARRVLCWKSLSKRGGRQW